MRTYSVINGRFWTEMSRTGVKIREAGIGATTMALYLVTNPYSNALGLYHLPLPAVSHDLRVSPEETLRFLDAVCATGFAEYFAEDSLVWVPQQARYQIGETMKASDHRRAWTLRELAKYKGTIAHGKFLERYGEAYKLISKPSSPLRLVPEGQAAGTEREQGESDQTRIAEARRLSQLLDESSHEH